MNRLKAYIKRTILESAKEYAYPKKRRTAESTYSAFRDYAHGTDTGVWSDLIYTRDVINMFNRYRSDCAEAIAYYLSETGQNASEPVNRNDKTTFADMLVACAKRKPLTWDDYISDDSARNDYGMAGTLAIRFAVEFLVSDVASELGVEL